MSSFASSVASSVAADVIRAEVASAERVITSGAIATSSVASCWPGAAFESHWVIVSDQLEQRLLGPLTPADASTLVACLTDDPHCWMDLVGLWPRYRNPASGEFLETLPSQIISADAWGCSTEHGERAECLANFEPRANWALIDLAEQRLFSGAGLGRLRRSGCFLLEQDDESDEDLIEICYALPPWWQITSDLTNPPALSSLTASGALAPSWSLASSLSDRRLILPSPHREILWGKPLSQFLAQQMVAAVRGERGLAVERLERADTRHELTVAIHKAWLLTSRADLAGRAPRDCLHEARQWLAETIDLQLSKMYAGYAAVPIPAELSSFMRAPLGLHEVVIYFHACRAMLDFGWEKLWQWGQQPAELSESHWQRLEGSLVDLLREHLQVWLVTEHADLEIPARVIQNERLRIPLPAVATQHDFECSCTICSVLAASAPVPKLVELDGHQLEQDQEFAFSLHESRADWEAAKRAGELTRPTPAPASNRCALQDFISINRSDRYPRDINGSLPLGSGCGVDVDDAKGIDVEEGDFSEGDSQSLPDDAFWQAEERDLGVPPLEDRFSHMMLSFRLTEIISVLSSQRRNQADIDALQGSFAAYRVALQPDLAEATRRFQHVLREVSLKHPEIVERTIDLHDRIEECFRVA
ncbi:hypothetical protein SH139x_004555 [Planctomycetaceae bacterium SH139]